MQRRNPGPAAFTEADGRQLAVNLLRELGEWDLAVNERVSATLDGDGMDDGGMMPCMADVLLDEEPVILRRYLELVRRTESAALERGFLCVLSHFIGEAIVESGGVEERYDDYLEPQRPPRAWRDLDGESRDGRAA